MTFIAKELRTALYVSLTQDSQISEHGLTGVYPGEAPDNKALPYIVIGGDVTVPFDSFQPKGHDTTVMIDLWDGIASGDRCFVLLGDVYRIFGEDLQINGHNTVKTVCEWHTIIENEEDKTRHVPIRLRVYSQVAA